MLDRLTISRVAFGIRFKNSFKIEDRLGEIMDAILASESHGADRFPEILYSQGQRRLIHQQNKETVTVGRADAIYDHPDTAISMDDVVPSAREFVDVVWKAVCDHGRPPAVMRYGCIIGFKLPDSWRPFEALAGQESIPTSEMLFRFSKRLPVDEALANASVNDYGNVHYTLFARGEENAAMIDFQRYFDPALESDKARRDNPYLRFVERAMAYYRGQGYDFLRTRVERMSRAA